MTVKKYLKQEKIKECVNFIWWKNENDLESTQRFFSKDELKDICDEILNKEVQEVVEEDECLEIYIM